MRARPDAIEETEEAFPEMSMFEIENQMAVGSTDKGAGRGGGGGDSQWWKH